MALQQIMTKHSQQLQSSRISTNLLKEAMAGMMAMAMSASDRKDLVRMLCHAMTRCAILYCLVDSGGKESEEDGNQTQTCIKGENISKECEPEIGAVSVLASDDSHGRTFYSATVIEAFRLDPLAVLRAIASLCNNKDSSIALRIVTFLHDHLLSKRTFLSDSSGVESTGAAKNAWGEDKRSWLAARLMNLSAQDRKLAAVLLREISDALSLLEGDATGLVIGSSLYTNTRKAIATIVQLVDLEVQSKTDSFEKSSLAKRQYQSRSRSAEGMSVGGVKRQKTSPGFSRKRKTPDLNRMLTNGGRKSRRGEVYQIKELTREYEKDNSREPSEEGEIEEGEALENISESKRAGYDRELAIEDRYDEYRSPKYLESRDRDELPREGSGKQSYLSDNPRRVNSRDWEDCLANRSAFDDTLRRQDNKREIFERSRSRDLPAYERNTGKPLSSGSSSLPAGATRALWIGGFRFHRGKGFHKDLLERFENFGPISSHRFIDRSGSAFINFLYLEDAAEARQRMDGVSVSGTRIRVEFKGENLQMSREGFEQQDGVKGGKFDAHASLDGRQSHRRGR